MKKSLLVLICVFALLEAKAQNSSWTYDFGTTSTAPYASTTYSSTYLPAAASGGGNAGVRASSATEGQIELTTASLAGGSGAELKMTSGTTVTGAKFGLAPFTGTTVAAFQCKINISSGTNGRFLLYFGNGSNFTSGSGLSLPQTFSALRLSPTSTAVNLDWLSSTTSPNYTTTGLTQTTINKNQGYTLKFFMNNSNSAASYSTGSGASQTTHNLVAGTFDIWIDNVKVLTNADPGTGLLPQGTSISGMNLLNIGAGSSAPVINIDDISYSNFLPPTLPPTGINSIKAKYVNWLLGEDVDYNNPHITDRYNRFISSGLAAMDLSGYDFANPGSAWNFTVPADEAAYATLVEQKLIRLVYLYHLKGPVGSPNPNYHSISLKDTIISIFNYMKAKGISGSTNFEYVIVPEIENVETSANGVALRSSAYAASILLMEEELKTAGEFANHLGALNALTNFIAPEFTAFPMTQPGFNTDVIRASILQRLCYILAQDDSSSRIENMNYLKTFLNNALKISNGWRDCIKPDFITFHHKGVYSNTYGSDALHQAAILNLMLDDTEWELDATAKSNIKEAILTYNKFSKGFEMPRSLGGRFPFNTDALNQLRPALAYLYIADPAVNEDAGREFIRLWNISTTANTNLIRSNALSINLFHTLGGIKDMLQVLNTGLNPLPERQEGQFNFPYAGLSVHKFNGHQVSIKGTSKHIWHYENSATENRFGRYTSAGSMEILAAGNPLTHATNGYVQNGWDWSRTPGVTAAYLPLNVLETGTHRLFNGKNMLAHASLDNNGVFAMDYKDMNSATSMTALKSVFFFKDKILCLGSNINNAGGTYPIQTTLFQTALSDINTPTYINGTAISGTSFSQTQTGGGLWATDAVGNGYVVPAVTANFEAITVQRSVQNSRNQSNTADTIDNYTTAYINHGVAPTGVSKYAYGVIMQGGQTGTQEFADNFATYFKIWHQNSSAHIAQYIPDSIFAYTIFNPSTEFTYDAVKKVDKPAVVMTQKINDGNNIKVSLTNHSLGLLTSTENYTYNQINASASIINRTPQIDVVTLTLVGHWLLASPTNNVTTNINGANTNIAFSTINGLTIQTELVKSTLAFNNKKNNTTVNTNVDACTYTVNANEFDVTATGNCGTSTLSYKLTGATTASGTGSLANKVFNKGETTVSWTATDGCTSNTTSFTIQVNDAEKPIFTEPVAINLNNDENQCAAAVILTQPAVTDNCTSITVSNNAPETFPIGTTTVTWTATDAGGNTATATQTITVTDTEAPIVNSNPSVTLCHEASGNYNIPAATAMDNCNVNSVTYQITGATARNGNGLDASGSFNVGTSTITWIVTDNTGNSSTTATAVTINSEITASIADVYAVSPGGQANTIYLGYGPSSLTLTATATNGTAPYSYSWNNGATTASTIVSPSTPGTHSYTLTITDALGCSITITKEITVEDVLCDDGKVKICHSSNPKHDKSLCISTTGVADHLAHGCSLGSCQNTSTLKNANITVYTQQQPTTEFTVTVAPNPSKTEFQINVTGDPVETVFVSVFDMSGRRINFFKSNANQTITTGSKLATGMYLAEIIQGENKKTVKLIKQ